jgi:hypothetical protein
MASEPTVVRQHHHTCDWDNPPDVEFQGCCCPNGWPRWIGTDGTRTVVGKRACARLVAEWRREHSK